MFSSSNKLSDAIKFTLKKNTDITVSIVILFLHSVSHLRIRYPHSVFIILPGNPLSTFCTHPFPGIRYPGTLYFPPPEFVIRDIQFSSPGIRYRSSFRELTHRYQHCTVITSHCYYYQMNETLFLYCICFILWLSCNMNKSPSRRKHGIISYN